MRFGGRVGGKRVQPADAVAFVDSGVGVKIAIGEVGKGHCHGHCFVEAKALVPDAIINRAGRRGGIQIAIDHLPPVNKEANAPGSILYFIAHGDQRPISVAQGRAFGQPDADVSAFVVFANDHVRSPKELVVEVLFLASPALDPMLLPVDSHLENHLVTKGYRGIKIGPQKHFLDAESKMDPKPLARVRVPGSRHGHGVPTPNRRMTNRQHTIGKPRLAGRRIAVLKDGSGPGSRFVQLVEDGRHRADRMR